MRFLEYREKSGHGTFDYPVAVYRVIPSHPRYQMPYHWHSEYEMIRVITGSFTVALDGTPLTLHPGDTAFIGAGVLHGGTPGEKCEYHCLVFDMNLLLGGNRICNRALAPIFNYEKQIQSLFPSQETRVKPYLDDLFSSAQSYEDGGQMLFLGSLCAFLSVVLRDQLYRQVLEKGQKRRELSRLKEVFAFIWAHYQEPLKLEDLARCSGMNSKYFCRFFHELTLRTPIEYLNYYRVECACEQMIISDKRVTEIAHDCGFNDVSYFAKVFRRFKGMTPTQYMVSSFASERMGESLPLQE